AVWLPRVHGRAGLRLLLPERAGRGQPLDGGVGRPGARLDPLDVAGAGQGPARAARARVIRVANAPLSYGAFELTVGIFPNVPGPEELVAEVARAGYAGIELGPPGYLGSSDTSSFSPAAGAHSTSASRSISRRTCASSCARSSSSTPPAARRGPSSATAARMR